MRTNGARWCSASCTRRTIGGVGALRRRARGLQVERLARVGGAAAHGIAGRAGRPAAARRSAPTRRSPRVADATTPSTGTTSPERTTTTSPGSTASTPTSCTFPSRRRWAMRGARSSSAVSSRLARRAAAASSALPPLSIRATTAPASSSPRASAPAIASRAMASTPTSPRRSERATDDRQGHEDDDERGRPDRVADARRAGEVRRAADGYRRRGEQRQQTGQALVHSAAARRPASSSPAEDATGPGTTSTGQWASRTSRVEVLPSSSRRTGPCAREPTTRRSRAALRRAELGGRPAGDGLVACRPRRVAAASCSGDRCRRHRHDLQRGSRRARQPSAERQRLA